MILFAYRCLSVQMGYNVRNACTIDLRNAVLVPCHTRSSQLEVYGNALFRLNLSITALKAGDASWCVRFCFCFCSSSVVWYGLHHATSFLFDSVQSGLQRSHVHPKQSSVGRLQLQPMIVSSPSPSRHRKHHVCPSSPRSTQHARQIFLPPHPVPMPSAFESFSTALGSAASPHLLPTHCRKQMKHVRAPQASHAMYPSRSFLVCGLR